MISFQAAATSAVVVGLSQLGNPSTLNTGRQSSPVFNEFGKKRAEERTGGISDIVSAMDGVFTVSGALNFLVLQLILVIVKARNIRMISKMVTF